MLAFAWALTLGLSAPVESPPEAPVVQVCARVRSGRTVDEGVRDAVEAQVADLEVPVDFDGTERVCEREVSFGLREDASGAYYELFVEDSTRPDERIVRTLGELEMSRGARDEMFALVVRRSLVAAVAGHAIEVERARIEAIESGQAEAQKPEQLRDETPGPPVDCARACPVEAPEPERGPEPGPTMRRNWARMSVAYQGRTWADELAWQNALRLSAGWEHISGVEVEAGVSLMRAVEIEDDLLYLRVTPLTFDLLGGYRVSWDRVSVAATAGLVIDSYARTTLSRATGLITTDDGRRAPVFGGHLGADGDLRLTGPLRLNLAVGATWSPQSFDFTVEEAGVSRTLLSLQALRFELLMGLRVQI